MRKTFLSWIVQIAIFGVFNFSTFADVQSWRNGGNGEYPESQAPVNWNDNIMWETPLENKSNASPILVGSRLFFCQEPSTLVCVDSESGETLWERSLDKMELLGFTEEQLQQVEALREQDAFYGREINRVSTDYRRIRNRLNQDPENEELKNQLQAKDDELSDIRKRRSASARVDKIETEALTITHPTNGYTSFTPVSDGKRVYVAFGQGILGAFDLEGNKIWEKAMERPNPSKGRNEWGGSTSPLIVDGKLIVRFSNYTALDPETGEEIWRLPSEPVYGTPAVFEVEGQSFLFTPRGELIKTSDGKVLQSGLVALHNENPWSVFNSPVIEGDVIYTMRGFRGDGHAHAFRIPKTLDKLHAAGLEEIWHTEIHMNRYYASPIAHEGLLYALSQYFVLTVLEMDTGEKVLEHKITGLRGQAYPSISLADGKLFLASDSGTLITLQPGPEYKELGRSQFETFRSTPIFQNDIAYLRTYEKLYAIREN